MIGPPPDCVDKPFRPAGLTIAKYKPYVAVFFPPQFADVLVEGLHQASLPEE